MNYKLNLTAHEAPRFYQRPIFLLVGVLVLVLATYYWGRLSGLGAAADLRESNKDLARLVNQTTIELRERKAALVLVKKGAEIDRLAAEAVRGDLLLLRQEAADLQRDVDFFRGLMAPDELQRGLRVHSFDLDFDESSGRYTFKAVITNAGGKGNVVKGELMLKLVATSSGTNKEFLFDELPEFLGSMPEKLRFRFFQNIQGTFKLPADFDPVSIGVSANVKDSGGEYFRASYRWGNLIQTDSGR